MTRGCGFERRPWLTFVICICKREKTENVRIKNFIFVAAQKSPQPRRPQREGKSPVSVRGARGGHRRRKRRKRRKTATKLQPFRLLSWSPFSGLPDFHSSLRLKTFWRFPGAILGIVNHVATPRFFSFQLLMRENWDKLSLSRRRGKWNLLLC